MVACEKSETIKSNRKTKIDEFANGHEETTKKKGHCNDDGKLDSSMKARCRRFFMHFDTMKHGKCDVNYLTQSNVKY